MSGQRNAQGVWLCTQHIPRKYSSVPFSSLPGWFQSCPSHQLVTEMRKLLCGCQRQFVLMDRFSLFVGICRMLLLCVRREAWYSFCLPVQPCPLLPMCHPDHIWWQEHFADWWWLDCVGGDQLRSCIHYSSVLADAILKLFADEFVVLRDKGRKSHLPS